GIRCGEAPNDAANASTRIVCKARVGRTIAHRGEPPHRKSRVVRKPGMGGKLSGLVGVVVIENLRALSSREVGKGIRRVRVLTRRVVLGKEPPESVIEQVFTAAPRVTPAHHPPCVVPDVAPGVGRSGTDRRGVWLEVEDQAPKRIEPELMHN